MLCLINKHDWLSDKQGNTLCNAHISSDRYIIWLDSLTLHTTLLYLFYKIVMYLQSVCMKSESTTHIKMKSIKTMYVHICVCVLNYIQPCHKHTPISTPSSSEYKFSNWSPFSSWQSEVANKSPIIRWYNTNPKCRPIQCYNPRLQLLTFYTQKKEIYLNTIRDRVAHTFFQSCCVKHPYPRLETKHVFFLTHTKQVWHSSLTTKKGKLLCIKKKIVNDWLDI